jgi:tetratricopeptide (TPR) repeat protein
VELDPRDPFVKGLYGTILAFLAPPEEAIQYLETMFEDNPGAGFGYESLGFAYRRAGRVDDETRAYRAEIAIYGWDWVAEAMDRGMEEGGGLEARRQGAEAMVDRFEETYVPAFWIAKFFRDVGERERALYWLDRTLEQHDPNLPYLGLLDWNAYYGDPRFLSVAEEVGVPLLGQLQFSGDNPSGGA